MMGDCATFTAAVLVLYYKQLMPNLPLSSLLRLWWLVTPVTGQGTSVTLTTPTAMAAVSPVSTISIRTGMSK